MTMACFCVRTQTPNHALEPSAASGLRALAVPSSLRSSAAAQRERWGAAGSGDAE